MRVLLSGYYGFGNVGDEALLDTIVARFRARLPNVEIDVLSAQPELTAQRLGVEATPRWDVGGVRAAIRRADVVLSGGGGLLQNATSQKSLLYYTGILHDAIRAGVKTMIFAQSVGPLDTFGRILVRTTCKGVRRATVRDERSRELLQSLLPHVCVERTADPVFLYEPAADAELLERDGLGAQSGPIAVVSVRPCSGFDAGIATIARAVDRLSSAHGLRVAFVPLGGPPDAEAATKIIRKCDSAPLLLPETSVAHTAAIIRRASVVIGMRLHALIFAARWGVPFLAIPYDPKVSALCADLAYPLEPLWTPGQPAPAPEAADAAVDRLIAQRERIAAYLPERAEAMRTLAERNFEIAQELLAE